MSYENEELNIYKLLNDNDNKYIIPFEQHIIELVIKYENKEIELKDIGEDTDLYKFTECLNYLNSEESLDNACKFIRNKLSTELLEDIFVKKTILVPRLHMFCRWSFDNCISRSKYLTIDFIKKQPNKNYDWDDVLCNKTISLKDIEDTEVIEDIINIPWVWKNISQCPTLSIGLIKKHLDKAQFWRSITMNEGITLEDIENNIDLPWSWYNVSENPNLTIDFVEKHLDKPWEWYIEHISQNKGITLKDIENNPNFRWKWHYISNNPNLTIDFVKKHLDKPWEWYYISVNSSITLKNMEDNPDLPWSWSNISHKPGLTIDFVKKYLDKLWDWDSISQNSGITMEDIENNIDFSWSWYHISLNPNLTIDFIKKHLNEQLDWAAISQNPGITGEDMENNLDFPWVWKYISQNPSLTIEFIEKYSEHIWVSYKIYDKYIEHNYKIILRNTCLSQDVINKISKI